MLAAMCKKGPTIAEQFMTLKAVPSRTVAWAFDKQFADWKENKWFTYI